MKEIKNYIIEGIKKAYIEFSWLRLDDHDFHSKATEYLFTVNVVQNLIKWRSQKNDPYNYPIFFEYDSNEFKANCFPSAKLIQEEAENIFSKSFFIKRLNHLSKRKGRIDIVVSEKKVGGWQRTYKSLHGIEIKAINPSKKKVLADYERLCDALINKDPIGENSLESCFVIYVQKLSRNKEMVSAAEVEKKKIKYRKKVNDFISKSSSYVGVSTIFELFDINIATTEEYSKSTPEEWLDFDEAASSTGLVIGVLIEIRKK